MFTKTRLKLTAWYLAIIMVVSLMFSAIIFRMLSREIERFERAQRFRIEVQLRERDASPSAQTFRRPPPQIPLTNPELLEETKQRIFLTLAMINAGIFVAAGGLGYFLAGRTLRPIQDMIDEQHRFISDASHELRTPITSLKSAIEVHLRDKRLTLSDAKKVLTQNREDVNKLQSLTDALLELAQYQQPNGTMHFSRFSLQKTIQKAGEKIQPQAHQKSISIIYPDADYTVEGNATSISDLFVILLDNAVKYSLNNTTILVNMKRTDIYAEICVTDQGMGIEKKDIPYIFDRFYRADSSRMKVSPAGYGIGLAIAKRIVDIHGGSISVESKPQKGTTFIIRLPVDHSRKKISFPFS